MFCVRQHISLSFGISNEVLPHDAFLTENLHRIKFVSFLVLDEINFTKTTTTKNLDRNELIWTSLFIIESLLVYIAHQRVFRLDHNLILRILQTRNLCCLHLWSLSLCGRIGNRCKLSLILVCHRVL